MTVHLLHVQEMHGEQTMARMEAGIEGAFWVNGKG